MPQPADLGLTNGRIITIDRRDSIAEAIAIAGDRIAAVGPAAAMSAQAGPSTRTIDLNGKAVIPGLVDGHAHMDHEGLKTVFVAQENAQTGSLPGGRMNCPAPRLASGRVDMPSRELLLSRSQSGRSQGVAGWSQSGPLPPNVRGSLIDANGK